MSEREPAKENYDAIVDFAPPKGVPDYIYALVKTTWEVPVHGAPRLTKPIPLGGDLRKKPKVIPTGSDFNIAKPGTDVIVRGDALAPDGKPVTVMDVTLRIGNIARTLRVTGNRRATLRDGRVEFSAPEPFDKMPLTWQNAYGGVDTLSETEEQRALSNAFEARAIRPGAYPRNPAGKGYAVELLPPEGIELPNVEDARQVLQPHTLLTSFDTPWWERPRPACLDWMPILFFPRSVYFALHSGKLPPFDQSLSEVRDGILLDRLPERLQSAREYERLGYQEASPGLSFNDLSPGSVIQIAGMTPDAPFINYTIPNHPEITTTLEGKKIKQPSRLLHVVLMPNERKMTLTYAAVRPEMHRKFVPGVYKDIPLTLSVEGDRAIPYEVPPTQQEIAEQSKKDANS